MALTGFQIFQLLPKTNCGDCGFTTCLAFASQVVSEKLDLGLCPHVPADLLEDSKAELAEQYREGRWTKRDMAADALEWARQKAASMELQDLPDRIGAQLVRWGLT